MLTEGDFVDANTGWVAGTFGTVLHTTDGGANWAKQEIGSTTHLMGIDFIDARTGWVVGEGGTIPFMGMLQDRFPEAQFVVTGLLGPKSNAHGPNEFLHIPTGKRVTEALPGTEKDLGSPGFRCPEENFGE